MNRKRIYPAALAVLAPSAASAADLTQRRVRYPAPKEANNAANVFGWLLTHWYIVIPAFVAVLVVAGIIQRRNENRRYEARRERLRQMEEEHRRSVGQFTRADLHRASAAAEQRRLMKPGLRYDVFRRDGFRCQICGASQASGATLHVDHIIPVSKGGKTELSNLRTLCDRCNIGKGAKLE